MSPRNEATRAKLLQIPAAEKSDQGSGHQSVQCDRDRAELCVQQADRVFQKSKIRFVWHGEKRQRAFCPAKQPGVRIFGYAVDKIILWIRRILL